MKKYFILLFFLSTTVYGWTGYSPDGNRIYIDDNDICETQELSITVIMPDGTEHPFKGQIVNQDIKEYRYSDYKNSIEVKQVIHIIDDNGVNYKFFAHMVKYKNY